MSKFWHNFPEITKEYRIDFGQGDTPLLNISDNNSQLFVKNETKNPNGSFKDRGLAYQFARHMMTGKTRFALSSSGNAAISAAHIARLYNFELSVFVGDSINPDKLTLLEDKIKDSPNIKVFKSKKPRSELIKFVREHSDFVNLRGSTDVYAPVGYKSIAFELMAAVPQLDSIFIPASSGTSAVGIASGFQQLGASVQIHICQSTKIHPIAKNFDKSFSVTSKSLADAITDKIAHRKIELLNLIQDSQGFGWVISDDELLQAKKLVDSKNIGDFSFNSVLAFSGFQKALRSGYNFKNPVLLFSGL